MDLVKPQSEMSDAEQEFRCKYAECLVGRHIVGRDAEWHVRRACELTDCSWASDFDWASRRDAFRDLEEEHPTISRAMAPRAAADVSTTMIYTHVLNRSGVGALSPADLRRPGA